MHKCSLKDGQTGVCGGRQNIKGSIVAKNYGEVTGFALDPIEKKPLARFYPGTNILSIGSFGCNLSCSFCQNYSISTANKGDIETLNITPVELAEKAVELISKNNIGVAYTYNEPMIGYEFVRDTAKEVHKRGLKNVVVTNGSVKTNILEEVLPYIDAFNIDLKGFTQEFYSWIGGNLEIVKDFIVAANSRSHVELTNLVIPQKNDTEKDFTRMVDWIASIDTEIPFHLSRFFPNYKMQNSPPTNIDTIYQFREIAEKKLKYVYLGNI